MGMYRSAVKIIILAHYKNALELPLSRLLVDETVVDGGSAKCPRFMACSMDVG
jgi:hypothetical protein